jgi:hypothetical protein
MDPHPTAPPSSSTPGVHLTRFAKTKTGAGNFSFEMMIPSLSFSSSSEGRRCPPLAQRLSAKPIHRARTIGVGVDTVPRIKADTAFVTRVRPPAPGHSPQTTDLLQGDIEEDLVDEADIAAVLDCLALRGDILRELACSASWPELAKSPDDGGDLP